MPDSYRGNSILCKEDKKERERERERDSFRLLTTTYGDSREKARQGSKNEYIRFWSIITIHTVLGSSCSTLLHPLIRNFCVDKKEKQSS